MSINNLFGISSYLSNLKLILTLIGISSVLSSISLLILTISHLKQISKSTRTQNAKNKIPTPDFPATI